MLLLSLIVLLSHTNFVQSTDPLPEQIHLAVTENEGEMNVAWMTFADAPTTLEYGIEEDKLDKSLSGTVYAWTYGGITRYNHNITITGLSPATKYYYKVKNGKVNSFKTFPLDKKGLKIFIFGDLGIDMGTNKEETPSFPSLLKANEEGKVDMIIHIGDIAYDLHYFNGTRGDEYMKKMEPIMAKIPYMVIAGNHEDDDLNFTNYKNRFQMPKGGGDATFWSFNFGPIHFVGVNTESYGYFYKYGTASTVAQYEWLKKDLTSVDRSKTPWVIGLMHRPFYCGNQNSGECTSLENNMIRDGWLNMPALEPLFLDHGMDINFAGHEHSYERFYPMAKNEFFDGPTAYHNPVAPVYIITGSGGCYSGIANFSVSKPPGSAKQLFKYGYTRLTVLSETELHLEQLDVLNNDQVVDEVKITKDKTHVHTAAMRKKSSRRRRSTFSEKYNGCPLDEQDCIRKLEVMNREL